MNKNQEDTLSMYESVDDVLHENETVWNTNVPFTEAVADFDEGIDAVNDLRDRQEVDNKGVAEDKENRRTKLENQTYLIGSVIAFFASKANNRELFNKVNFTATELRDGRDNELPGMANQVHQAAVANAVAILPYGITAGMTTDLGNFTNDFVTYISKPRAARADSAAATAQLVPGFETADKILKEQLDKGMELYRESANDFYVAYHNARIIVNSPTLKRALDVHIQDSVTNISLEHVNVTIDGTIHKRSSSLGNSRQQNLTEGAHTITVALPGYVSQTQNFNVISGETTKLIILMVKV